VLHKENLLKMRLFDEKGQGLTEYITLLVLVSLVAVGAAKSVGTTVRNKLETARRHINQDINFDEVR
jgi:Flp pilus assembly pilin Flp